ncbi:unnamed protein product [Schistosoma curassoni]|nr:unnamed protein product [Schistosoma curassoni]
MDLLILLLNLNKIESNLIIMKSNMSFNNNISINLYHNNNNHNIKNQYIIDHHHDSYNISNNQIIHKIERRSHSKQSGQQQPHQQQQQEQQQHQQPITNYYEPEEILSPDYTLPYQDIKCMEFIQSTEIKYIKDSSSMLNGFFGMSNLPKRTIEYSFQTPNYPAPYPLNIECIKVIAAPTDQHRIVLHFRGTFELEPESHCTTDFLEIRDGAFGFTTLLGRFCSKQVPDLGTGLISTGQYMWLRFHSDSTIAHRGFQAVYRFIQTGSHKPTDSVSHVQFQINLQPGQAWKLDQQYLLMKMEKLSPKIQQLPLEVALDIRSTNGTYIMLHIDHVQVPQSAAWSCQPESTFTKLTRIKCLTGEPIVFGLEKKMNGNDITDSGLNKLSLQDPSSIIDGQHTFFEVYPGKTISQFVPPCPKIIRFCDKTLGILKLPKNHGSDRDFYIRYPRLIIRMVIASPNLKPDLLDTIKTRRDLTYFNNDNNDSRNSSNHNSLEENKLKYSSTILHHHHHRRHRYLRQTVNIMNKIDEKLQEYMPKFVFILTSLKQKSMDGKPCVKDWEACDSEVCIPKHLWCDDIINCPQWQDEGGHCTRSSLHPNVLGPDGQLIPDTSKSVFELRKEQEQLEAEAERLAAQKLHLSILATLGLILLIVTSTCIFMTIRRRRRETARQMIKSKEDEQTIQSSKFDDRRLQRLNHVMSTGALLEGNNHLKKDYNNNNNNYKKKPIFTLSNSSLTQEIQYLNNATNNSNNNNNNQSIMMHELKSMKKSGSRNTTMIWNSTDSINAPLLWQRNVENMKSSSSPGQMNSNKNLIKYSFIKTKGNHNNNNNNTSGKLSNKKFTPIKQCSTEKEPMECVQFQNFNNNNNTTNNIKSSIVSVNNSMNESINLPNTTMNSIRTMTNILRDKSTQPTSLTHTYGSYPITSYEQTDVYDRNKHNLNTFVQKRTIEQQQQQQQEQSKRSGNKKESHSVLSSPQNRGNWIATNIYPKIDKELPILTNTHLSPTDHDLKQRIPNINNTINRTQSWGGGLRYNNNNVHIYCQQDNQSPSMYKIQNLPHFKPSQLSSIPKCQLYSISNSQEHLYRIKRSDTYVSMPDVNGLHNNSELLNNQLTNYHHRMLCNAKQIIPITSTTLTSGVGLINIVTCSTTCTGQLITSSKDYRPPQAKRPRIINSFISSNVTSNNDNNNNNVVSNVNKLSRHATPIHNENNFNNTVTSHLTTTTITITNTTTTTNNNSSSSSDKSSISSNPYSGSEHSHVLLNPNYQHLHHQHHHSQSPHHHHHHHQILYPSVGIQNVLLTDDKLSCNKQIYGLNDFQRNMLMYGSNTSTVDNIRTNIERYKYHKENNDDDEEEEEEDEGSTEEREGDCEKTKKSRRTNLIVATDHVDDDDNGDETTLSRTDSKNSLELLKGEDETDMENSENSPVNNSTSISETDTSQNACSTHEEPIKITVYQSEPYGHRTISHSSLSPTKSISPHSSPKHQQQHHHRHHHHHQYKPKYVTDRDKSSHLQIRSDDQNVSETSSDLIYEYEA